MFEARRKRRASTRAPAHPADSGHDGRSGDEPAADHRLDRARVGRAAGAARHARRHSAGVRCIAGRVSFLRTQSPRRLFLLTASTGLGFAAALMFLVGLRMVLADPRPAYDLWARTALALGIAVFVLGAGAHGVLGHARVSRRRRFHPTRRASCGTSIRASSTCRTCSRSRLGIAFAVAIFATGAMKPWAAWLSLAVAVGARNLVVHVGEERSLRRRPAQSLSSVAASTRSG